MLMRRLFLFLCALFLLTSTGSTQERPGGKLLIPYRYKNLWGYCDTLGRVIIQPAYDSVTFIYFTPTIKVFRKGKATIIDATGKKLLPYFDFIFDWSEKLFAVKDGNKFGIYNEQGAIVVPVEYDHLYYTSTYEKYRSIENSVIAAKGNLYFLISLLDKGITAIDNPEKGTVIYEGVSEDGDRQGQGITKVFVPERQAYVDSLKVALQADSVVRIGIEDVAESYWNKYYKVYSKGMVGLWNKNLLIRPTYSDIRRIYLSKSSMVAARKGKYGLVNLKEQVMIPFAYDDIEMLDQNIFITTIKKKKGAVLLNTFYPPLRNKYDAIAFGANLFVNEGWRFFIFKVVKNGKRGYVGENGIEYFSE
jgi:hypothetical protein